jgi:hypothetical protein
MTLEVEVLIVLPKNDCSFLKDDVEAHIQDIEEALSEHDPSPLWIDIYRTELRFWKRILASLKKSLDVES